MRRLFSTLLATTFGLTLAAAQKPITVTILHTNDLHAHIEPTKIRGAEFGGYARTATLIRQFRQKDPNVLLLNAGDTFQGTLFFNVYEGLADLACMNAIGYQAMAVGNHEFDKGPMPLARFASLATFPILSSNLDLTNEPRLKGLIMPYTVLQTGGQKVGVIGLTTETTPSISSPGDTVKFLESASSVNRSVQQLEAQGVNKIILLSHIGYEDDRALAGKLRGVDLIIGGHSHSPLGTPDLPGWRKAVGPYPTLAKDAEGKDLRIVQAWEWGKVLGRIQLDFDAKGVVTGVKAAEAVVVDQTIPEDPLIRSIVAAYKIPIAEMENTPVGESKVPLTRDGAGGSASLQQIIPDAMLAATEKMGAVVAFVNGGGIRSNLDAGRITYGGAISVQPFNNTLVLVELTGAELLATFEKGADSGQLFPSRGTSWRVDRQKPVGSRVSDVIIAGKPLDLNAVYRTAQLSFISAGGDGHVIVRDAKGARTDTGILDIDVLVDFLKQNSPLGPTGPARITVVN